MEGTQVSAEALQKALETLGLVKAEVTAPIAEAKVETVEAPVVDEVKKALETELDAILQKAEEIKLQLNTPTEAKKEIVKAEVPTEKEVTAPSASDELIKSFESKILALGTLWQSEKEEKVELKKAVDEVLASNKQLVEFNTVLARKLAIVEKQPMERKSVDVSIVAKEKFEKAENGARVLSMSNPAQRQEISSTLFNEFAKGEHKDKELEKALQYVDLGDLATNSTDRKRIMERLLTTHKIQVVK